MKNEFTAIFQFEKKGKNVREREREDALYRYIQM